MTGTFDAAILGGGPAGTACAAALARAGRSVVLLERSAYRAPRPGETLAAAAGPLLDEFGARAAAGECGGIEFPAVRSAWGSDAAVERPAILDPLGPGWHVDRLRFDRALARHARRCGAVVRADAGACAVARAGDAWTVTTERTGTFRSRWMVDASGRGAPATARAQAFVPRRWHACDRLVGVSRVFPAPPHGAAGNELLLEAAPDGWWYSVPQPGGRLLVAYMTDSDLILPGGPAAVASRWSAALGRSGATRERVGGARSRARLRVVRADTGRSVPAQGDGWSLAGDAREACDPLSGQGVVRALRSGLRVARAVDAALRGEGAPADDAAGFESMLRQRASYYGAERRWPGSVFWARRHVPDFESEPLVLSPSAVLRWDGMETDAARLAPVEALWGGMSSVRVALEALRAPLPAHEVLAAVRRHLPLGDRRLLVGLQRLAVALAG